jgi:putative heme-binding domain-containing protein
MNADLPLKEARLIDAKPVQGDLGLPDARVISPGDPSRSVLLQRMATGGRGHMPYLGGQSVDNRGVTLIRDWIASLAPESNLPEPVRSQRDSERTMTSQLTKGDSNPLDQLLGTPSGALSVALAVTDGSLEARVSEQAIAKGSALSDPLRRDLFERFLPESKRRRVLGANFNPETVLAQRGDSARGRPLFSAICANCHRIGDTGRDIGPDLSRIGTKYDRATLLGHVIEPTKVIDPQWQLTTVTLANSESLSGFLTRRDGSALIFKQMDGQTRRIETRDIKSSTTSRVSLMPERLLESLTAQEAADVLEFVAAFK